MKKIFKDQWLNLKPYHKQTIADTYYMKLANEIKSALHKIAFKQNRNTILATLAEDEVDDLCCFLASYFEDIISETNIWNTFIKIHKRLYNKPFPFFSAEPYFENEINIQDVQFLIWYYYNIIFDDEFISPYEEEFLSITGVVMEIFDKKYEFAPENIQLKRSYAIDENETDFYVNRDLIDKILFGTYLFYPDTGIKLKLLTEEIFEDNETRNPNNIIEIIQETRDSSLHSYKTRLLSMSGKEWAAALLGENHPISKDLSNMSKKILSFFFYKGQDEKDVFLEHIASGKEFKMTKKSFDYSENLKETDLLFIGIVRWRDEWWFSGIFFAEEYSEKKVSSEKRSMMSRMAVSFLDKDSDTMKEVTEKQYETFLKFNKGSQIAFMLSEEIDSFNKAFYEFYNSSIELTEEQRKKTKKRKEIPYFDSDESMNDEDMYDEDMSETALAFYNPNGGLEFALGINNAFPSENNPYYNADESGEDIEFLLMSEEMSTELVMFWIENYKDKLPFFQTDFGKIFTDNIDFLLRFWKKENYLSNIKITIV